MYSLPCLTDITNHVLKNCQVENTTRSVTFNASHGSRFIWFSSIVHFDLTMIWYFNVQKGQQMPVVSLDIPNPKKEEREREREHVLFE